MATLIGLGALLLGCARPVAVADGATIIDGSRHYRLWGVEVPGLHQSCAEEWPAGQIARQTLEALIGGRRIACEDRGLDRYRRTVALCRVNGVDLGASMVGAGMAWASDSAYAGIERDARRASRGLHGFGCQPQPDGPPDGPTARE